MGRRQYLQRFPNFELHGRRLGDPVADHLRGSPQGRQRPFVLVESDTVSIAGGDSRLRGQILTPNFPATVRVRSEGFDRLG